LHKDDIGILKSQLGLPYTVFVPSIVVDKPNIYRFRDGEIGLGILSKIPLNHTQVDYHSKPSLETPIFNDKDGNYCNRALLSAKIQTPDGSMRVSTTHFTWTADGAPNSERRVHVAQLVELITKQNVDIICGDFNAPHGAEIMTYIGNVIESRMPTGVETTPDPKLHRAKGVKLVVDNIFSRPGRRPAEFQVVGGLSDHKALVTRFLMDQTNRPPTPPEGHFNRAPPAHSFRFSKNTVICRTGPAVTYLTAVCLPIPRP
jgi:endonuclease/exonuclease/phosphatase family metal-dependent hydrolase